VKRSGSWIVRLILLAVPILALAMVSASKRPPAQAQNSRPVQLATDWSHRHVVFSAPGSLEQAWRLQAEPRFWHQWSRRNRPTLPVTNTDLKSASQGEGEDQDTDRGEIHNRPGRAKSSLQRDWGASLGNGATGGDESYPAKFTFDVNAAPSCANDFIVFNTGVAPGSATAAQRTGTFTAQPVAGTTVTIGGTLVLTASAVNNAGLNFQIGGNTTATATNLAAAITRNGAGVGVTAASAGTVVTVTAAVAGAAGNSITLASTILPASFAWASASLAGGANAPGTILGFNNLYSTQNGATPSGLCGTAGPSILFSYNTDIGTNGLGTTTGTARSSVVLSLDGSKIAFVETGDGGGAILRLLLWAADPVQNPPAAPDQVIPAGSAWTSCTGAAPHSCLIGLRFGNAAQDTESAPFYVYQSDTLYVGDDTGKLHKFINVFGISGAIPSEVTTGGWPVTVNGAGNVRLHSPVFDSVSGNIFVGDLAGNIYYVKDSGSVAGVCSSGSNGGVVPCLGTTNGAAGGPTSIALGGAIDDAPIVDSTTQRVFFFDGTANAATCPGVGVHTALVQLDTQLTSASEVKICLANSNAAPAPVTNMKSGAFDNAYVSSAAGSKTGKLYFCGRIPVNRDRPALFRVGFNASGVMNATVDANSGGAGNNYLGLVNTSGEECSPLTEIFNTTTNIDWLFLSVGNNASLGSCLAANGGCLMSFNLTALGATWPPGGVTAAYNLPPSAATPGNGGSSGIILDNVSNAAQASNIYFTFLANSSANATCNGVLNTGCAVKLTQAALQ
jgi:hypothetical protein